MSKDASSSLDASLLDPAALPDDPALLKRFILEERRQRAVIIAQIKEEAARQLSKVGGERVTEQMIRADLAAGAPVNTDGTINLVHYAAWLVKERSGGD